MKTKFAILYILCVFSSCGKYMQDKDFLNQLNNQDPIINPTDIFNRLDTVKYLALDDLGCDSTDTMGLTSSIYSEDFIWRNSVFEFYIQYRGYQYGTCNQLILLKKKLTDNTPVLLQNIEFGINLFYKDTIMDVNDDDVNEILLREITNGNVELNGSRLLMLDTNTMLFKSVEGFDTLYNLYFLNKQYFVTENWPNWPGLPPDSVDHLILRYDLYKWVSRDKYQLIRQQYDEPIDAPPD